MIKNREDLQKYLRYEKDLYVHKGELLELIVMGEVRYKIYKFVKLLRFTEYFHNKIGIHNKLLYIAFRRRKNKLGIKLGIEMWDNCFEEGLTIYHAGNIVINGDVKAGKNCKLHGSNCIGNNGKEFKCPVLGDNVRLGVGAKVIGDVTIADNITIASGSVVVNSFLEPGILIGGVPARKIK